MLLSIRDLVEFGMDRPGAKRGHGNPAVARFGTDRFGKTGDVCFCGRVNRNARRGRNPAEELTFKIAPRFCAIMRGSNARVSAVNASTFTWIC